MAVTDIPSASSLPGTSRCRHPVRNAAVQFRSECKEGNLKERKSRWGKFFYGCDRYPECKFASWDKPLPTPCPQCGSPILVEKVTKRAGRTHRCYKKECGYSIPVAEQ